MRGFIVLVLFGLVALVAGAAGFQAGVMSNVAGGAAPYVWLWGFPHFGGFLFFLLFLGLLLFAFGGRHRWGSHRAWGPGYGRGFGPMDSRDDPRRQWIAEAHRRLHEEEARSTTANQGSSAAGQAGGPDRPSAG